MAQAEHYTQIIVEGDALNLYNGSISRSNRVDEFSVVLSDVNFLLTTFTNVSFRWMSRNCNKVADRFASEAVMMFDSSYVSREPPDFVVPLLQQNRCTSNCNLH